MKPQDRMVRKKHGSTLGFLRDVRRCLLDHWERAVLTPNLS